MPSNSGIPTNVPSRMLRSNKASSNSRRLKSSRYTVHSVAELENTSSPKLTTLTCTAWQYSFARRFLWEVTLYFGQETPRTSPDFIKHMKWENENRMVWHIEYPQFDNRDTGITIWKSVR